MSFGLKGFRCNSARAMLLGLLEEGERQGLGLPLLRIWGGGRSVILRLIFLRLKKFENPK